MTEPGQRDASTESGGDRGDRGNGGDRGDDGGDAWTPPAAFDEYRLVRRLGAGAMGEVHLAEDVLLQRPVAVKFVRAAPDASTAASERFYVEARAIARLQHPHVVAVYRIGRVRQRPYLVSEYVPGESLDRVALPLSAERVLAIGAALASGLAAAHRRGVLHRDIKPANVIVSAAGDIKLVDFGLAKLLDDREPGAPAGSPDGAVDHAGHGGGAQTQPGALLGSPLYMAPELWRGEPASVLSDLYALGVVLHELCAGQPPLVELSLAERREHLERDELPSLAAAAPGVPPRLAAAIDRCVRRDPAARFPGADALRRELDAVQAGGAAAGAPATAGDPYRGLQAFTAEHRAVFFGRDDDARAIVDRLRGDPFVLVIGDSGIGKSSLCAAGVLPRIADGALEPAGAARRAWSWVELAPGRRPLAALARALAPALDAEEDRVLAWLRRDPAALGRALQRRLGPDRGLAIYVDQLEELLGVADPDELGDAAVALSELALRAPGRRLLASARSDFLTRLTTLPGIGGDIASSLYLLGPLTRDGVREAIVGPARAAGVEFESASLVDELAGAAAGGDGLPLLQFALAALWQTRDRRRGVIPAAALDAIGGVAGALVGHADRVLDRLGPAQHAAVRSVLVRLVTSDGTRTERTADELAASPEARAALEALVRARLVIARERDRDGPVSYELAHEVLISAWGTLRAWLSGDVERRAAGERLERAAREWQRLGRPLDALWTRRQLDEIAGLEPAGLDPRAAEFAATSRRVLRRRRRLRRGLGAGAVLAAALIYAAVRLQASRALDERVAAQLAGAERALANARALDDQIAHGTQRALRAYDDVPYPDGDVLHAADELWTGLGASTATRDGELDRAERAVETALLLDGSRRDARDAMAELLAIRARAADRLYQLAARDAYRDRRRLYTGGGDQPVTAVVAIATLPPGAVIEAARYAGGDRRALGPARRIGTAPLETELGAGSYLLTLTAPGRDPVRYPLLLGGGERRRIAVDIPDAVPPGMVYIPAGRFLYGSGDGDAMREFAQAQPLHEVEVPGYLIGRHEVTFAAWIEFLRALPADERRRRTPDAADALGAVSVEELPGGWRLTLQAAPGAPTLRAMSGAPIVYPGRRRRAKQDWLKFPVTGISWDDFVAYTAWLDGTRKVPGARPCSEREWERAGRGADDRRYPHGDVLQPDDADFDLTYDQRLGAYGPDEVGSHPASDSPFGVADLIGNAWEPARSLQLDQVVLCSATFYRDRNSNRLVTRALGDHQLRNVQIGARVCADAPHRKPSRE